MLGNRNKKPKISARSGDKTMLIWKRRRPIYCMEEIGRELEEKEAEIGTLSQDLPGSSKENEEIQQRAINIEQSLKPLHQLGQR
jgi:bifunctional DNase/RNase